ncbi:iron-containing alcohol dehydrogenase [Streptomyces sp. NPDC001351]|uniref:iron-containing alcohol dehydrogenase n=1 Tax=Streptomyces sp. NPDC001351 TaxID=3364564 RepID=UPI0036C17D2E
MYGARLCGTCLGATTMGLHHKLCHVPGGTFDLPHAETHAVVLPHVPAFNAPAVPEALAALRRALDVPDPERELHELGEQPGIPRSLADLDLTTADIDRPVKFAVTAPYGNPREASADDLRAVPHAAWAGEPRYGG